MHPLQSHILKSLTLQERARFADLKPHGTESNRFVYHLKCLIDDGFVRKTARSYSLTASGIRFISKLSLKSFLPRLQPKIVTVLIVQDQEGKYLLLTSKRQPFISKTCFPYGKIHFGESLQEAANRELKEKAGLTGVSKHCGDSYLIIREHGEIVAHLLCHVFYTNNANGSLIKETKTHSLSWLKLEEIPKNMFVPGFLELNRLRLKKARFFTELAV